METITTTNSFKLDNLLLEMKAFMKPKKAIKYALSLKPSYPKYLDDNPEESAERLIVAKEYLKIRKTIDFIILEYIYFTLDFYNVVPVKSQKKVLKKVQNFQDKYGKYSSTDYVEYYSELKSLVNLF